MTAPAATVHSADCPNVRNLLYNPEREIEVRWARQKDDVYQVSLVIETADQVRQGGITDITFSTSE